MSASALSATSSSSSRVPSRALCAPCQSSNRGEEIPADHIYVVLSFLKMQEMCAVARTSRTFYGCCNKTRRLRAAAYAVTEDSLLRERTIAQFEQAGVIDLFGGRSFLERLPHCSRLSFLGDCRKIAIADLDRLQYQCGSSIVLVGDLHVSDNAALPKFYSLGILMFVRDKTSLVPREAFTDIGEPVRRGLRSKGALPVRCVIFCPREMLIIKQIEMYPDQCSLLIRGDYDTTGLASFFSRLCHRMPTGLPIDGRWYERFEETMPTVRETYTTTVTRDRCCCGPREETVQREREVPTLSLTDALPPTAVPYMPPPPAGPDLPPSSSGTRGDCSCIVM